MGRDIGAGTEGDAEDVALGVVDECPAGGAHTYRRMTAWERSVDWVDGCSVAAFGGSGWYCTECDERADDPR